MYQEFEVNYLLDSSNLQLPLQETILQCFPLHCFPPYIAPWMKSRVSRLLPFFLKHFFPGFHGPHLQSASMNKIFINSDGFLCFKIKKNFKITQISIMTLTFDLNHNIVLIPLHVFPVVTVSNLEMPRSVILVTSVFHCYLAFLRIGLIQCYSSNS